VLLADIFQTAGDIRKYISPLGASKSHRTGFSMRLSAKETLAGKEVTKLVADLLDSSEREHGEK